MCSPASLEADLMALSFGAPIAWVLPYTSPPRRWRRGAGLGSGAPLRRSLFIGGVMHARCVGVVLAMLFARAQRSHQDDSQDSQCVHVDAAMIPPSCLCFRIRRGEWMSRPSPSAHGGAPWRHALWGRPMCATWRLRFLATTSRRARSDSSDNMKSSRTHTSPEAFSNPVLGARVVAIIPMKWRGVVLLGGTIIFFPIIIGVMMIDAVVHDMPGPAAWLKKSRGAISGWIYAWRKIPQRVEGSLQLPQMSGS